MSLGQREKPRKTNLFESDRNSRNVNCPCFLGWIARSRVETERTAEKVSARSRCRLWACDQSPEFFWFSLYTFRHDAIIHPCQTQSRVANLTSGDV